MIKLKHKTLVIFRWAPPVAGGPNLIYYLFSNFDPTTYCLLTSYKNTHSGNLTDNWLSAPYYYYDSWNLPSFDFKKNNLLTKCQKLPFLKNFIYLIQKAIQAIKIINQGYKLIKQEKIEIIFSVSDAGHSFLTGLVLSLFTGRPLVIYLLDLYKDNLLPRRWKLLAFLIEPLVFYRASKIIVTNEGTREFYLHQYPRLSFKVISNSTNITQYQNLISPYKPTPPYSIVFTGHLYWAQLQSVENLLQAVKEISQPEITLTLYILNPPSDLIARYASNPRITFTTAPQEQMPAIQTKADILFLPLAWDTTCPAIIKTATPGKLTDYLASGRPILIHAPDYAYLSRYGKQYGFAEVVDQNDVNLLKAAILKIVMDPIYTQTLITNAQDTFNSFHNANTNSQCLVKILSEIN